MERPPAPIPAAPVVGLVGRAVYRSIRSQTLSQAPAESRSSQMPPAYAIKVLTDAQIRKQGRHARREGRGHRGKLTSFVCDNTTYSKILAITAAERGKSRSSIIRRLIQLGMNEYDRRLAEQLKKEQVID
jgi:hypothetical protein